MLASLIWVIIGSKCAWFICVVIENIYIENIYVES